MEAHLSPPPTFWSILKNPEVEQLLSGVQVKWNFNIERAQWWEGLFERKIQVLKCCLKKMVGHLKLTFKELLTNVTEVELILNSRHLTYLSPDDLEEPITPSHLMTGRRLLSLPDHLCYSASEDFEMESSRLTIRATPTLKRDPGSYLDSVEKGVSGGVAGESQENI
uniref:Uncharacterized protein n=1 Tax=Amphimedon queenslandica TaxID=400682 RepID=A0A1X7TVP5_AMPQE